MIDNLLQKGLLIRAKATKHEIEGSLAIAQHFLDRAKGTMALNYYDVSFSLAYQSMFHSARALLFNKGFKERSHSAIISALLEIYDDNLELKQYLNKLNSYKVSRHAIQYDGASCNSPDAQVAIKYAEKFLGLADSILAKEKVWP